MPGKGLSLAVVNRQSGDWYRYQLCAYIGAITAGGVGPYHVVPYIRSIAGAGLAALGTFKKTLVSGGQQAPLNVHINLKLSSENVTIVSPQPLEVIGPQFDFKFVDTAYNLTGLSNSTNAPLTVALRNTTFEVALFPSNIHFIPDSDPPTAEAKMLVFTHPGLAEGPYNLTVSEWVWNSMNIPTAFSRFEVPVEFSFNPKAREDATAREEL